MGMKVQPEFLQVLFFSAILVAGAFSASNPVGDIWKSSAPIFYSSMSSSLDDSKLVLTGGMGFNSQTMVTTFTTWTPEGLGETLSFTIAPGEYSQCDNLNSGFMQAPSQEDNYYLTWMCTPSVENEMTHLYFAKLNADGTIIAQKMLEVPQKMTVLGFPVTFLSETLVAAVKSDDGSILLGLDSDLETSFHLTTSSDLQIGALAGVPQTDQFVVGGTSTGGEIYLGVFEAGKVQTESTFTLPSGVASFNDIAVTSSKVLLIYGLNKGFQATLFNLESLDMVKTLKFDIELNGCYHALAFENTFAIVQPEYPYFWIFNESMEQTNSLTLTKPGGNPIQYTSATLAQQDYLVVSTIVMSPEFRRVGTAVWGYNLADPIPEDRQPPTMSLGVNLVPQSVSIPWGAPFADLVPGSATTRTIKLDYQPFEPENTSNVDRVSTFLAQSPN